MQCDENNEKTGRSECTCKYLQLNLSSTTAAEYGDLTSLARRLSSQSSSSVNKIHTIAGNTPLHLSAQHGHAAITTYLLRNGYDPNTGLLSQSSALPQSSPTHINESEMQDERSNNDEYSTPTPTPLHRACHSGALGCIQLLIDAHADIMIPDLSFGDGMNAMHKAVKGGRPLAVILLLKHIKSSSISFRREVLTSLDSKHRTPLQVARDSMKLGEDEISSLRRWDVVAGGSRANFEACVKLLEQEEEDIGIVDLVISPSSHSVDSDGGEVGQITLETRGAGMRRQLKNQKGSGVDITVGWRLGDSSKNKSRKNEALLSDDGSREVSGLVCRTIPYQYVPTFELSCDCAEEMVSSNGAMKCKTAVWEEAFEKSLFKSTMASLLPMTQHRNNYTRWQVDKSNNNKKCDDNDVLLKQPGKRIESSDTLPTEQSKGEPHIREEERRSTLPIRNTVVNQGTGTKEPPLTNQGRTTSRLENPDTKKVLGQPCSKCTKNSLTLFRDSLGNLVCRTCLKHKNKRRH